MHFYKNGNYTVCIQNNGTKIRRTDADEFIPEFAENIDVKLTDRCSQNCPFCYEGSTKDGEHSKIFDENGEPLQNWLRNLHPYTEIALNGNDMDHPELLQFLIYLANKNVITNITVNQKQFIDNFSMLYDLCNRNAVHPVLIHGLGVSLQKYNEEFYECAKWFPNLVVHTIVGVTQIEQYKKLMYKNFKVLVLGYKTRGRGITYNEWFNPLYNIEKYKEFFNDLVFDEYKFNCVSFDNLALDQLDIKNLLFSDKEDEWNMLYMGDDGRFTFYIDMVKQEFSKNSLCETRHKMNDTTIDEMFNVINTYS